MQYSPAFHRGKRFSEKRPTGRRGPKRLKLYCVACKKPMKFKFQQHYYFALERSLGWRRGRLTSYHMSCISRDEIAIMLRVHGNFCHLCFGAFRNRWEVTKDHDIPRSKGGPNSLWNLKPAHFSCNNGKGNLTSEQFRRSRMAS